jgi:hypothetical protein
MGAGEGERIIHRPGHLYIDYGCPININEQGRSKLGHQDGKMRPKPVVLLKVSQYLR